MGKAGKAFGVIIGIVVIIVAFGALFHNYSNVQQASKDVDVACQVLKNRTVDVQNALKEVENTGGATSEQMQSTGQAVQSYNDKCAARTGAL